VPRRAVRPAAASLAALESEPAAETQVRGGLPNALTLVSLGLGFMAALSAGAEETDNALRLLALAALADLLAGWTAQGMKQATPIGAELDSLAGLFTWGVATALLLFEASFAALGGWGAALAGLVAVGAAWRLCRGDTQTQRPVYEGLPLSAAGAAYAALVALNPPVWAAVTVVALVSLALLGPWRYPRVKGGFLRMAPVFLSLAAAALFGWKPGWILPGLAAFAYAAAAPFLFRGEARL